MQKLGGSLFVCDGIRYDYPFIEAIESMLPVCDEVAVTLFNDDDWILFSTHFAGHEQFKKLKWFKAERWRFDQTKGPKRLAFWTNFTKNLLSTDWHFNLQADEILHENSYEPMRRAITEVKEAFIVRRFNLWGDPYHMINYPKVEAEGGYSRLPCGNHTGRLAKIKYLACMDAENLNAQFSHDYAETIKTFHMGFVRNRKIMVVKSINIQEKIFGVERADEKFYQDIEKNNGEFDPYTRFSKDELMPIPERLPEIIRAWAKERAYGAAET